MVCVGYLGIEAFDIILYIGQTLNKLKYPVLIIDLSNSGAIKKSIYHGMDIDSANDMVHYRNINYISRIPHKKELDEFIEGMVLVVFGFNYTDIESIPLDCLNIVVDSFPNNLDKVNHLLQDIPTDSLRIRILIRDIISIDDLDRIKNSINLPNKPVNIDYLYFNITDYENALQCQLTQVVRFRRISNRMKKIIISEVKDIIPNIKQSKIRRAAFFAGKGA